ncbi:MAG: hypothetical protein P8Y17_00570 [Patescibacteria group bacterium]
MRKEILFAILAGLVFGLIIAFGVWRANIALMPGGSDSTEETPTPTPVAFGITIADPQNLQVITESPVTISGITKPGAQVAISGEEEDYVVTADANGEFEVDVELSGGVNEIIIDAFDENGSGTEEKLVLVYSTEFAEGGEQ